MAGRVPKYDVSLRGEEYKKGKWRWHNIGAAWENENGSISIEVSFPCNLILNSNTKIRLFVKDVKDNFSSTLQGDQHAITDEDIPF